MAARDEEGRREKHVFTHIFLVREGLVPLILSNGDIGVATGTVIQEIRPRVGFKTGDFLKEILGGGGRLP